jgi:hypothetical protein
LNMHVTRSVQGLIEYITTPEQVKWNNEIYKIYKIIFNLTTNYLD